MVQLINKQNTWIMCEHLHLYIYIHQVHSHVHVHACTVAHLVCWFPEVVVVLCTLAEVEGCEVQVNN